MDLRIALGHRPGNAAWPDRFLARLRGPGIALLVALSALLLWSWLPVPDETAELPAANQLVHWRDAGHDWLLVVDPQTRELVVYDANDGRPLQRLGVDDGVPPVQSIVLQGARLFVTGAKHLRVRLLELPQLRTVAAGER